MLCPPKNHGCLHQSEVNVQSGGGCATQAAASSDTIASKAGNGGLLTVEISLLYIRSRTETMIQWQFGWFHYITIESVLNYEYNI
jgi:hypothetical protein